MKLDPAFSLFNRLLRIFFHLLYNSFAGAYDLVAAVVSFGHWRSWIQTVIPYLQGTVVLELGHGPGHLQKELLDRGRPVIGLDESIQMGRIAHRRMGPSSRLIRGLAQSLPFADGSLDSVFATFPSEYIFDPPTLKELRRCLHKGGRLVVLPYAWPRNRMLTWLYRITGEVPADGIARLSERIKKPFSEAGFHTEMQMVEVKSSSLMIMIAERN